MRRFAICALVLGSGLAAAAKIGPAGVHGAPPSGNRAWAECDRNRPNPPMVVAREGEVPSDAFVVIGKDEALTRERIRRADGKPLGWTFRDGVFQMTRKGGGSGYLKGEWADFQMHVEWKTPKGFENRWAGGNSGVVIHPGRRYEIQILDSSRTDGKDGPGHMPDYADGQAGAVYGQTPPLVNPSRPPDAWQTYDIIFHAALWEKGRLVHPATVSVIYNGVLVQDNWEMWERTPPPSNDKRAGGIYLQDHGYDVAFRNLWIRELKPRWANTTHGGPYAKPEDVKALREKTAAQLFAEMPADGEPSAQRVDQALEILCYSQAPKYREVVEREERRYLEALAKMDGKALDRQSYGIRRLKKVYDQLIGKDRLVAPDNPMARKCDELIKARNFTGHVYWW